MIQKIEKSKSCPPKSNLRRHQNKYRVSKMVGEGTFGKVYKCFKKKNPNKFYAIKRIQFQKEFNEGFPFTSIREIKLLKQLKHENIVQIKSIYTSRGSKLQQKIPSTFIVMEFMDQDLWGVFRERVKQQKKQFSISEIKNIIYQIFKGLQYLHNKNVIHRDLKGANILINKKGILKIADFGLSKFKGISRYMTQEVVTFPYRAPEITLGYLDYDEKIDIWSVGCLMTELLIGTNLFCQQDQKQQLDFMFRLLGDPRKSWKQISQLRFWNAFKPEKRYENRLQKFLYKKRGDVSDNCIDLIQKCFDFNPLKRISAKEALKHPFFSELPKMTQNLNLITTQKQKNFGEFSPQETFQSSNNFSFKEDGLRLAKKSFLDQTLVEKNQFKLFNMQWVFFLFNKFSHFNNELISRKYYQTSSQKFGKL